MAYTKSKRLRLLIDAKSNYEFHKESEKENPANELMARMWRNEYAMRYRQIFGVELGENV